MIKCENSCPLDKFEGCCYCCPNFDSCPEQCQENPDTCGESTFDEESGLDTFKASQMTVLQSIASIVNQKKALEAQEKEMKDKLKQAMEQFGIKKFSSDILDIVYVAEGTKNTFDTTKFKKDHPDLASAYNNTSKTSSYIKVTVKKEGDK